MPYCTQAYVEFYGQFSSGDFSDKGYNYENTLEKTIADASAKIDNYCGKPEGFFEAGGATITDEYLNGADVAHLGGVTRYFTWYYGGLSHLKFKHSPVLSVTKLEEETASGAWTERTEGTDFIVVEDGVRLIQNTPALRYKNVRVTYIAGYATLPNAISQVAGQLAAALLHRILAATEIKFSVDGVSISSDAKLTDELLTDALKADLESFKKAVYGFA